MKCRKQIRLRMQRAFTLFEAILALAILGLIVVGIAQFLGVAGGMATDAQRMRDARRLIQSERARHMSGTAALERRSRSEFADGTMILETTIEPVRGQEGDLANLYEVQMTVEWPGTSLEPMEVTYIVPGRPQ